MNIGYCPGYCCVANRELGRGIVRYCSNSAVVARCRGAKGNTCCIALTGICINGYRAGQEMVGFWLSFTVTVCAQVAEFP